MDNKNDYESIIASQKKDINFLRKQLDAAISAYNTLKQDSASNKNYITDLFSKINHEVRTPMNSISGYSDLLILESSDSKTLEYAKSIKSSSNRLIDIFSNLIDLTSIQLGLTVLNEQEYSTETLLKSVIKDAKLAASFKDIELKLRIHNNIPLWLFGDITHIRQIIHNLISNGINSTAKGYVYMEISCEIHKQTALITVIVKDTGVGIKLSDKKKIESILNDTETANLSNNSTIDYSLIIANHFAKLMNGSLSIDSKYGKGSTYTCCFKQTIINPVPIPAEFITQITADNTKVITAPNAKVLVVDDSRVNLSVAQNMLKQFDINADLASNGYNALKMISNHKYDLVFMDHMMPDIDGIETTERIRATKGSYYKYLPIVALTANATDNARQLLMEHGMNDYMSKPIDKEVLMDMLYKWLPKSKIKFKDSCVEKEEFHKKNTYFFEKTGIDIDEGLSYTGGNMENYMDVLRTLHKESQNYINKLNNALSDDNMQDYGIYVHSLKGALASLGASSLSAFAKDLELKAKAGDSQYIHLHNTYLIEQFTEFTNNVNDIIVSYDMENPPKDTKDTAKPMISDEILYEKLKSICSDIDNYEIDNALNTLASIKDYELQKDLLAFIEDIETKIDDFEYDEAISAINEKFQL